MRSRQHPRSMFNRRMGIAGRGFSLVSAVFLVVVLAGLGAAMLSMSNVEHATSALDVQGARAYQAARAGIEWGVFQEIRNGNCSSSTSFSMPATSTLSSFTVTVSCTATNYSPATLGIAVSPAISRFRITAVACNQPASGNCPGAGGTADYVQRELQVEF